MIQVEREYHSLAEDCLKRFRAEVNVQCILLEQEEQCDDVARVFVVADRGELQRQRWTFGSRRIDCSIASVKVFDLNIALGKQHNLVRQMASGQCIFGNATIADALRNAASARLATAPPSLPPALLLALSYQVEDLLHAFFRVGEADVDAAALTLASLVRSCLDCYFAAKNLWAVAPSRAFAVIEEIDPAASRVFRRVVSAPVGVLYRDPSRLNSLVAIACRDAIVPTNRDEVTNESTATRNILQMNRKITAALDTYKRGIQAPPPTGKILSA